MKVEWLDRRIAKPGPYMTLCLTEDEFETAMKHLRVRNYPAFVTEGADATVHHMSNNDGSGGRCEDCGRPATEMHHRTYQHPVLPLEDNFGIERPDDLAHLCRECHRARHRDAAGNYWRDEDERAAYWTTYESEMERG